MTLFAGLGTAGYAVAGVAHAVPERRRKRIRACRRISWRRLAEEVARKLNQRRDGIGSTSAPSGGIAPEAAGLVGSALRPTHGPAMQDRGIYHAADAMREHVRDGRCAKLLDLRRHHGPQWQLLPLHELRIDERMFLAPVSKAGFINIQPIQSLHLGLGLLPGPIFICIWNRTLDWQENIYSYREFEIL